MRTTLDNSCKYAFTWFKIKCLGPALVLLGHYVSAAKWTIGKVQAVTARCSNRGGMPLMVFLREARALLTFRAFAA
jgi:hypothetical protein